MGWMVNATLQPVHFWEKPRHEFDVRWAPGVIRMSFGKRKSIAPIGVRTQDCPARSDPLYRVVVVVVVVVVVIIYSGKYRSSPGQDSKPGPMKQKAGG
jgi:hypothetical protein